MRGQQTRPLYYTVKRPVSDHPSSGRLREVVAYKNRTTAGESFPRSGPGTSTFVQDNLLQAISKLRHI